MAWMCSKTAIKYYCIARLIMRKFHLKHTKSKMLLSLSPLKCRSHYLTVYIAIHQKRFIAFNFFSITRRFKTIINLFTAFEPFDWKFMQVWGLKNIWKTFRDCWGYFNALAFLIDMVDRWFFGFFSVEKRCNLWNWFCFRLDVILIRIWMFLFLNRILCHKLAKKFIKENPLIRIV